MKNVTHLRRSLLIMIVVFACLAAGNALFRPASTQAASITPTFARGVPLTTSTPIAIPGSGGSCAVTYTVEVQFSGGFNVQMIIQNTGSTTINGWSLTFTFPNGQVIQSDINANYAQVGGHVTATNRTWNGVVLPGQAVIGPPGFNASWNNIANDPPPSFTLNGVLCS